MAYLCQNEKYLKITTECFLPPHSCAIETPLIINIWESKYCDENGMILKNTFVGFKNYNK